MEEKKKNIIIVVLSAIIVLLIALIVLVATGTISFKSNDVDNNDNQIVTDNNDDDDDEESNIVVNITREEANDIVKNTMDKFYEEIFYGHKNTYCGEYDYSDSIAGERATQYSSSKTYSNLNDLKEHLNTYIVSNLVDEMLDGGDIPNYIEKDGKLYCLVHGRGSLSYDKSNTTYSVQKFTDTSISATANVSALAEGNNPNTINATLVIEKINDKWLLSTYNEKNA